MARQRICARQFAFEEPVVNLTPLIDVVFVILITFILIAPLLELDRINLADSPIGGTAHSVQESHAVAIHVHQDNSIWFDAQKVTLTQLTDLLKEAKKKYPQVNPQLFHDKRAHFGTYQAVKNAAEQAGYTQMDVILKPA